MQGLAAFVLAGGKSTRMGADKALLELGDRTLLARALEVAGTVAEQVAIVGDPQRFLSYGRVVEDVYPERGPLGGIQAALAGQGGELNLMLAVDLPFVEPRFLQYLAAAAESAAIVTVPRTEDGWQPLCAIYRREFGAIAEAALRQGKNKIDALYAQVVTRVIDEKELRRMGFSTGMFRNLNTPQDFERAAKLEGAEWSLEQNER
jgi:molybdopterin-guanine dinucleotide biosynthesis protein A